MTDHDAMVLASHIGDTLNEQPFLCIWSSKDGEMSSLSNISEEMRDAFALLYVARGTCIHNDTSMVHKGGHPSC